MTASVSRSEQVVILAGGLATRLGPLARSVPKALQPVGGRSFLDVMLEPVRACGLRRYHFCLGHLAEAIRRHLAHAYFDLDVTTSVERGPRGTAGALLDCLDQLDDVFLLLLGDTYLDIDYAAVVDALPDEAMGLMVATSAECGVPPNVVSSANWVDKYDKRGIPGGLTDTGVAILRKSALTSLTPSPGPMDLGAVFQRLITQRRLAALKIGEQFHDVGTPERYRNFTAGLAPTGGRRDRTP